MKSFVTLSMLVLVIVTAAGPTRAAEPTSITPTDELAGPGSFLIIGRITQIDAQILLVQDDGEAPVRIEVTPGTVTPGNLKIGDQVMVSLNQSGKATVITRGQVEAEVSRLDESAQQVR